jgi:hypothetical protein
MLIEAMQHAIELAALNAVTGSEGNPWNRLVTLIDRNLNTLTKPNR